MAPLSLNGWRQHLPAIGGACIKPHVLLGWRQRLPRHGEMHVVPQGLCGRWQCLLCKKDVRMEPPDLHVWWQRLSRTGEACLVLFGLCGSNSAFPATVERTRYAVLPLRLTTEPSSRKWSARGAVWPSCLAAALTSVLDVLGVRPHGRQR